MNGWMVLVNSSAGSKGVSQRRLTEALENNSVTATIEAPSGRDEMARFAVDAAEQGWDRIAVVGGDGTLSLVADALLSNGGPMPALGFLPAGTGCDFLRSFGISQSLEEAAGHLRGDQMYTCDAGVIDGSWGSRHFMNVGQAGVGAAAAETATKLPRGLGSVKYIGAFGMRLPRFPIGEILLETAKRRYEGRAIDVIFSNAQFFAGGWNVAPRANLMDGELDIQVINAKKTYAVQLVPKIVKGVHLTDKAVTRYSSPGFTLETEHPWPIEVDGDALGHTPMKARTIPGAVRFKI